jgi:medium-chain acyl-[acyl-carrier-protein] hydrolase
MSAPRTTHYVRVRSYEIRPDGRASGSTLLNWFQEAAFANSTELGYPPRRYQELGITWVLRELDLEIVDRPRYDEVIAITTWIADLRRVKAHRQYEARREDGSILARCNAQWAMLDLSTQRPTRIPARMFEVFTPAQDFVLEGRAWPSIDGAVFRSSHYVAYHEEDEQAHVNNANYLRWIEENARRAARESALPMPEFSRHRLQYRLPARRDECVTIESLYASQEQALAWSHRIFRDDSLLMEGSSLSHLPQPASGEE